ncbi:MAG: hypothetical protein IJA07_05515 [Agathobacter sp.]|nr:hypothetical protein [Agathobacter sp.]
MQKKEENTKFAREFSAVHDAIRDMCARGYRGRLDYKRIGVESSTYDNRLKKQIESMLNETEAFPNGRFVYKPMEWQENPLAGVFRYVIPDEQKFVYYYGILSILARQYKEDLQSFAEGTGLEGLEISDICDEMQVYSKDGGIIPYRQVWRKLQDLKEQYIISEIKGSDGETRYKLNDPIWDYFEMEELEKIYDCLCFLENVQPFGFPYYLLRKNLELWMWKLGEEEWDAYAKELFLFRHRNPLAILDSEMIYACLHSAKKKEKDILCYLNLEPYEFLGEMQDKKNKGYKYKYVPVLLNPNHLEYDCYTGLITVSGECVGGEEKVGKIPVKNLLFLDKEVTTGGEVSFRKKPLSHVDDIFHNINSIYFERLIELRLQDDRNKWTKDELIEHFFRGKEYWYSDVFDRVVLGEKNKVYKKDAKQEKEEKKSKIAVTCFRETKEKGIFERVAWDVREQDMFYTPRLAVEALKSIPEMEDFTEYFLDEELIEKIRTCTEDYALTWNVKDISLVNRKDNESSFSKEEKILKTRELIRNFHEIGLVYDKDDKEYYMLRLQYSIYKNEFRVLAQETSGEERLTLLALDNVIFKKRFADREKLEAARNNYKSKLKDSMETMKFRLCNRVKLDWSDLFSEIQKLEDVYKKLGILEENKSDIDKVKEDLETLRLSCQKKNKKQYTEINKMQWDNLFTDGWMSLLSAYEHETTYELPEPGMPSGDFEVTLHYWKEDKDEILGEFRNFHSVYEMIIT